MTKLILTSRPSVRPHAAGDAPMRRYRRGAVGFTLIELMVSIAIMAIIMLAFGGLLTQANQVVTEGEKRMRSDAAASAISRIIRNDIRQITKNGFLRIGRIKIDAGGAGGGAEEKYRHVLVLVTAGKTQSSFSDDSGDGGVILYGRSDEESDDPSALYRKVLVLSQDSTGNVKDCINPARNLADLQVLSDSEMADLIDELGEEPENMKYPPETLQQVTETSWMVLAGGCTELKIEYRSPGSKTWSEGLATHTRHNQTSWPTAIKFKFKLKSDSLIGSAISDSTDDEGDVQYEIICPIGH